MGLILFIILGGIAGWLASIIMKTDDQQGILLNILIGVVGAFLGGLVFNAFGAYGVTGFNLWSLLVSVLGAVLLLAIVRALQR